MDNIMDEKQNLNKKIIIYSSILTAIIFILIGNLNLITMLCSDTLSFSKFDVLRKGFSMSVLDVGILYIVFGIFVYTVLKDKKHILKNYVKAKAKNNSLLNKNIKFLNTIILISVSINLFIKFILYFVFKKALISSFNIGFDSLLLSLFYSVLVTCILYLLVIISYISIKDFISGTFVYCMIFAVLSVVLGVGSLFISKSISFIQNVLSLVYTVYNPIIMPFYAFYNVYNESLLTNVSVILTLGIVVLALICIFRSSLSSLNKDNIKTFYINSAFRKIFFASIAIALSYIVFLIGFLLLISFNFLTYDVGILIINLIQAIFAIILYLKFNKFYINKQTLRKQDNNKLKNHENLLDNHIGLEREDILTDVHTRLNSNRSYDNNLGKTMVFKSINLQSELEDCEKLKDFSFSDVDEYLLNQDDLNINNNLDNGLKNEIIINKEIERNREEENLIDFLNSDNTIKS